MSTEFQVLGANTKAPFTLKIHRGDGMALLAMNWRNGKPPKDFVGFAIEYKEPKSDRFWPLKNRIGFPGQRTKFDDPPVESTKAPFQKFRWLHVPVNAHLVGKFTYRVTPMFMNESGTLSAGETQLAALALMRETVPGKLNIAYTRGFVSSQAFVARFQKFGDIATLVPGKSIDGLSFKATHPKTKEAHDWMGFEARSEILDVLDQAIAKKAEVRVIAYDLNLPDILDRLVKIGKRLRVIIDDSTTTKKGVVTGHGASDSPESAAERRLIKSAGAANVKRQHMSNLQHHKCIAVKGLNKVVYGATNFTWRGMFVQSNNAIVVTSKKATDDLFEAFEDYFAANSGKEFKVTKFAKGWHSLGLTGLDAKVSFSPHSEQNGMLQSIGDEIDSAKSSVLFSLAFLGQMKKGAVVTALGRAIKNTKVHTLGIADARVDPDNLGVEVLSPDQQRRVVNSASLTKNIPPPFSEEPTGLSGSATSSHRGTRMHHKFVVVDFNTPNARVYSGSYNFSEPADVENGENLVCIRDRTVATSYAVEAIRLYDHYRFRTTQKSGGKKAKAILALKVPPQTKSQSAWWERDWSEPERKRDRELFA